jgi:hypothetical protein
MKFIFWCEFPDQIDWTMAKSLIDFHADIYIACRNLSEFKHWKSQAKSSNIKICAWPVLAKSHGYWFSGFTAKDDIDMLRQFKGIDLKIDVEPPIPLKRGYSFISMAAWLFPYMFQRGKNRHYLYRIIIGLSKNSNVILSTFPFPLFVLENYIPSVNGRNIQRNYMAYSTFIPCMLKPLFRFYMGWFMRKRLKEDSSTIFAVGLLGHGIFRNEPVYKDVLQLRNDILWLKSLGVRTIAVYRLGAVLDRPESLKVIREFI